MCVCSDPRAGEKFLFIKIVPPAHPSVKRVPGINCTEEQSTLAAHHMQLPLTVIAATVSVQAVVDTGSCTRPQKQSSALHGRYIVDQEEEEEYMREHQQYFLSDSDDD